MMVMKANMMMIMILMMTMMMMMMMMMMIRGSHERSNSTVTSETLPSKNSQNYSRPLCHLWASGVDHDDLCQKFWSFCTTTTTTTTTKGPDNPTSQLLPILSKKCCTGDGAGRKDKGGGGGKMVCDKDGVVKDGVRQSCVWKMVCQRWGVTKWCVKRRCVKDGLWRCVKKDDVCVCLSQQQLLQEALCTAPATRQPATAQRRPQRAPAPPEGSVYCACHTKRAAARCDKWCDELCCDEWCGAVMSCDGGRAGGRGRGSGGCKAKNKNPTQWCGEQQQQQQQQQQQPQQQEQQQQQPQCGPEFDYRLLVLHFTPCLNPGPGASGIPRFPVLQWHQASAESIWIFLAGQVENLGEKCGNSKNFHQSGKLKNRHQNEFGEDQELMKSLERNGKIMYIPVR